MMLRPARVVLVLATAALLVACERPLVDPLDINVQVVSPDLEQALVVPTLALELRALGGAPGATVRVAGQEAPLDPVRGVYQVSLRLETGLNALPVEIAESERVTLRDTLYALYLDVRPAPATDLPLLAPRAAASATVLRDGSTLVAGGLGMSGPLASATRLAATGSAGTVPLATARAGHTASLLPTGEVLLLGGATTLDPTSPSQFVETAEVLSPSGTSVAPVAVEGGAFLRAGHTTRVLTDSGGRTVIYVYGGRDASAGPVATTGTVAILEWTADRRLVRLTPPIGAGAFAPAAFHLQLDLAGSSDQAVVLDGAPPDGNAFRFVWREPGLNYPFNVLINPARGLHTPRRAAAAVRLDDHLVLVAGGQTPAGDVTGRLEVYAPSAGRAFRLGEEATLGVPRAHATAAIFGGRRMVIWGGLQRSGALRTDAESFSF